MNKYEWVDQELERRGYDLQDAHWAGIRNSIVALFKKLDVQQYKEEDKRIIASLFSDLILSRPSSDIPKEVWTDFKIGETRSGDRVRVRKDAYEGAGASHNGLVGLIVGIRGGRVAVQYDGRNEGTGHYHSPDRLEVLAK